MRTKLLFIACLLTIITFSSMAQEYVGYWKFDEGSGTTVSDEHGTTNGELIKSIEGT